MKIFDLNVDKMNELEDKYNKKIEELDILLITCPKETWIKELNEF